MYGDDYSAFYTLIVGLMAVAAVGGLAISMIGPRLTRQRALIAWLSLPLPMSVGLAVFEAIPPFLFAMVFAILLPPWLIAAAPAFGISRHVQRKLAKRGAKSKTHDESGFHLRS